MSDLFSLNEAKDILRVDGTDNDELIDSFIQAIPGYILTTTGMDLDDQKTEPLVKVAGGFLLRLWYFADQADDMKLQRTIDALLKIITLNARATTSTTGYKIVPVTDEEIDEATLCLQD